MPDEFPNEVPLDPVVSVVVITYNHVGHIAQALDSILMQRTSFSVEICIGEDGSTDGTREICVEYAKKYKDKIRLFRRSAEGKIYICGVKTGRRNALQTRRATRGKYIAILEGDDFWIDPDKLQKQYELMEADDRLPMVAARCLYWDSEGSSEVRPYHYHGNWAKYQDLVSTKIHPHTSTYFVRKNAVEKLPQWTTEVLQGDLAFVLALCMEPGGCVIMSDVVSVYRMHVQGMSGKPWLTRCRYMADFWDKYAAYCADNGQQDLAKQARRRSKRLKSLENYSRGARFYIKVAFYLRAFMFDPAWIPALCKDNLKRMILRIIQK